MTEPWRNRIVGSCEEAPDQLLASPSNWRIHPKNQQDALSGALNELGWIQQIVVNQRTGHVIDGHLRVSLAISKREPSVPVVYVDLSEEEEALALLTLDPIAAMAAADKEQLDALLRDVQTGDAGLMAMLAELAAKEGLAYGEQTEAATPEQRPALSDRFIVPPFSVLDARQGYWQERKRRWLALGIQSELGRGDCMPSGASSVYAGSSEWAGVRGPNRACPGGSPRPSATLGADGKTQRGDGKGRDLMKGEHEVGSHRAQATFLNCEADGDPVSLKIKAVGMSRRSADQRSNLTGAPPRPDWAVGTGTENMASGTSIFDPVLCELAYRWFSPPNAQVLDPFAGGSVRGIVAALLGRQYVGIDLSERQIEANREQAARICQTVTPAWVVGDGRDAAALAAGYYDFVFSCPPYADLEVYSDDPRDLSTLDYPAFLAAYREIIAAAVAMLKPDRFACFCVGEVRDRKGIYRGFVPDTIRAFEDAGARLYNEAILVTAVGSLPIRVGKQFSGGRKLGKTHQNVLVFVKGNPKKATEACGPVDVTVPEELQD